ncbi:MAG: NAD(P)/FAD-dependent oxidoreductase [Spirochaetales bacterium]|uniref:NAD(P)/FAD-dependent oxidoreductase n=1 Tax=Candidatus Thalassospirochaeta sargassi TaxID=3119039 RepID=A0AAJ1IBP8_9SPIO|nr:NAD(P)/FAD-dependent oxidoreductase [Spirochaetales bacterium]
MEKYDVIIVGSGPAGLGAAFHLLKKNSNLKIMMLEREKVSTGGLRNDCKMNFTFPIGFPLENWTREQAEHYLEMVIHELKPDIFKKKNLSTYFKRAENLGVELLDIKQTHLGTDGGLRLIKQLIAELQECGVDIKLETEMTGIDAAGKSIITDKGEFRYEKLLIAPGRKGFRFLQSVMDSLEVQYIDHIVDIGVRIETKLENYPIVTDYYDPKFLFPDKVRTFCTNSGAAHVVREKYGTASGKPYFSVNGHAFSGDRAPNGLVNFAMLKTVTFTQPLASGQEFAENLGLQAMLMGGGKPIMQRVGDFRLGKRSKAESFNDDLYNFEPTQPNCTPGDISLSMPAKILRGIWKSMKALDTIIPGVLHPGTIMYYPEIKLYANKPEYLDGNFKAYDNIYFAGDGAGTSRGITAAWASGIRAAEGILG